MLKTEDFTYHLPAGLIAQEPLSPRDHSRLLVLHRKTGTLEHLHFYDLPSLLSPGDLLVLNDTRVLPARLFGHRKGGTGRVEILLLRPAGENAWEIICSPGKRARAGSRLVFGDGRLEGEIRQILSSGNRIIAFEPSPGNRLSSLLDELGKVPLPPYIKKELHDGERYQTVYSREKGSAAAPTAGLHFTPRVFENLQNRGIGWVFLTLHIGLGTFRPVKTELVADHHMHSEHYAIFRQAVEKINATQKAGGRVIAVGTTCCRVLETCSDGKGLLQEGQGETGIFIYPGYRFRATHGLLTNFHLPRSTLLMLTCAFAGRENVLRAYQEAVQLKYRFYSFGDCMFMI